MKASAWRTVCGPGVKTNPLVGSARFALLLKVRKTALGGLNRTVAPLCEKTDLRLLLELMSGQIEHDLVAVSAHDRIGHFERLARTQIGDALCRQRWRSGFDLQQSGLGAVQ